MNMIAALKHTQLPQPLLIPLIIALVLKFHLDTHIAVLMDIMNIPQL
jgi:hypothetical protein